MTGAARGVSWAETRLSDPPHLNQQFIQHRQSEFKGKSSFSPIGFLPYEQLVQYRSLGE